MGNASPMAQSTQALSKALNGSSVDQAVGALARSLCERVLAGLPLLEADLRQARADLAVKDEELAALRSGTDSRDNQLAEARAQLLEAQAQLQQMRCLSQPGPGSATIPPMQELVPVQRSLTPRSMGASSACQGLDGSVVRMTSPQRTVAAVATGVRIPYSGGSLGSPRSPSLGQAIHASAPSIAIAVPRTISTQHITAGHATSVRATSPPCPAPAFGFRLGASGSAAALRSASPPVRVATSPPRTGSPHPPAVAASAAAPWQFSAPPSANTSGGSIRAAILPDDPTGEIQSQRVFIRNEIRRLEAQLASLPDDARSRSSRSPGRSGA